MIPIILAACIGPACCVIYDTPAVCRSPILEAQAKAIVLRQCRRCAPREVTAWIYTFQMNRGPYESASELARHVLFMIGAK